MLRQRVITAVVLAPLLLLAIIYLPYLAFAYLTGAIVALAAWEWSNLAALTPDQRKLYVVIFIACLFGVANLPPAVGHWLILLAMPLWLLNFIFVCRYPESARYWSMRGSRGLMGLLILVSAWLALLILHQQPQGWKVILVLLALIWSADIGAYFSGKAMGRRKLAPAVSPGKTWEGFYGGLAGAILAACLFSVAFGLVQLNDWQMLLQIVLIALVCATISVIGDLTESMFKRYRGVKDSSQLLPGHGGVLDRIDSLIAALPFYALLMGYVKL